MDLNKLLEAIETEFFKELDKKTAWGKEQVKSIYVTTTLRAVLNELKDENNEKSVH